MTQFTTIDIIIPSTTRTAMPFCPFCKCEIPHVGGHAFTPSRWCDSSVPLVIHPHTSLSINLVVTVSIPDWQQLRLAALHWPLLFRLLSHKNYSKSPSLVTSSLQPRPVHIIIEIACRLPYTLYKVYSIGRWFNNKTSAFLSYLRSCCFSCTLGELRSAKHTPIQHTVPKVYIASPIAQVA